MPFRKNFTWDEIVEHFPTSFTKEERDQTLESYQKQFSYNDAIDTLERAINMAQKVNNCSRLDTIVLAINNAFLYGTMLASEVMIGCCIAGFIELQNQEATTDLIHTIMDGDIVLASEEARAAAERKAAAK